ncbi:unnamed protein product [Camellia sinensis]
MAGDKPVATCLHRADDLLQQSMFRLDDEFRLEDEARDGEEDAGTASEEAVGGGGVTGGLLVVEGDESNAESIVVLVLENRSFDHMIGWMKNSINPSINGVTGKECNPVSTKDQDQPQTQSICFKDDAEFVDPDPGHSFEAVEQQVFGSGPIPSMTGFVEQALSMSQNLTETNLSVIEPRYFDIKGLPANDDHPSHDVANGQKLVKEVYETLRASPQWNETLLVITYDEHGVLGLLNIKPARERKLVCCGVVLPPLHTERKKKERRSCISWMMRGPAGGQGEAAARR